MRKLPTFPKVFAVALAAVVATVLAAGSPAGAAKSSSSEPVTLRLGYFPNVTHASALVGTEGGIFAKQLGSGIDLKLATFNSGTEELAAFQAGALDAGYIGPNPTITAWTQLDKSVRVISGAVDVLLMDEPFGALDAMTRDVLHEELDKVWRDTGLTIVFVTHNVREAVRLGDRVVLLSSRPGRVIHEFPVTIDRPRRMDSPDIAALAASITDELREEVRRHGGR